MKTRNDFTQRLAEFGWWGCVLLSMFAVVQTARGSVERSAPARSDSTQLTQTSAAFDASPHQVTIRAAIPITARDQAAEDGCAGDLRVPRA